MFLTISLGRGASLRPCAWSHRSLQCSGADTARAMFSHLWLLQLGCLSPRLTSGPLVGGQVCSSPYVQTSRQVVHQIQAQICTSILEGSPAPGLIEEELHQQINQFVSAQGGNGNQVAALHSVMFWNSTAGSWSLKGKFPAITVDPHSHARATADLHPLQVEPDEITEDAPFFVTVSRSGFRRLRVSQACAVRQERCLEWRPVQVVTADCADAVCKLCKPKLDASKEESSQSASDSESAAVPDS